MKLNFSGFLKVFLCSAAFLFLSPQMQAQQTPQQLGALMFRAFNTGSVDSLVALQMTFDDVSAFARENGLDRDSALIENFRKSYPLVVEKYRMHYRQIMDEGMERKTDWRAAATDSMTVQEEDVRIAEERHAKISMLTLYFHAAEKAYHLTADIYLCQGIWKLGSNIDLFNDSITAE